MHVGDAAAQGLSRSPSLMLGMRSLLRSRGGSPLAAGRAIRCQQQCSTSRGFAQPAAATGATQQRDPAQHKAAQRAPGNRSNLRQGNPSEAPQSRAKSAGGDAIRTAGQQVIEERAAELGPSSVSRASITLLLWKDVHVACRSIFPAAGCGQPQSRVCVLSSARCGCNVRWHSRQKSVSETVEGSPDSLISEACRVVNGWLN